MVFKERAGEYREKATPLRQHSESAGRTFVGADNEVVEERCYSDAIFGAQNVGCCEKMGEAGRHLVRCEEERVPSRVSMTLFLRFFFKKHQNIVSSFSNTSYPSQPLKINPASLPM